MFLCPMLRNGGTVESRKSYRCWPWFSMAQDPASKGVTLVDVGEDMLEVLPEMADPVHLKRLTFAG